MAIGPGRTYIVVRCRQCSLMETGKRDAVRFYFCEACGVRVTEDQIKAGEARDKKLKGVFCKTYAVGVTTLDTLPLSDSDALALLKTEREKPHAAGSSGRRRTSEARIQRRASPPMR